MAVTPEFVSDVSEALDELGYAVESEQDVIDDVSEINDDLTLPGIRVQSGTMTGYVSMKLAVLVAYLQGRFEAIQSAWNTWFGTDATSGVQKQWADLSGDAVAKTTAANTAATNANTKAAEAERVNAVPNGTYIEVTDRQGNKHMTDNLKGDKGDKGDKGEKGDKGDDIDYSTMTEEEKAELSETVIQHIVSENILGPHYNPATRTIVYPISSGVTYDEENRCIRLG